METQVINEPSPELKELLNLYKNAVKSIKEHSLVGAFPFFDNKVAVDKLLAQELTERGYI